MPYTVRELDTLMMLVAARLNPESAGETTPTLEEVENLYPKLVDHRRRVLSQEHYNALTKGKK